MTDLKTIRDELQEAIDGIGGELPDIVGESTLNELAEHIAKKIGAERERCAAIVQAARFDEVDRDWRCLISMIEGGRPAADLIAENRVPL